jgi:hypothetical protein
MQKDAESFHTQLKQMYLIYSHSCFTIIAAAGSDDSHGLPGVHVPRKCSPSITIGQRTLRSRPFMVHRELDLSPWNGRAWTFQEGLLATLRHVFTEKKVYFECQGYYRFEGVPLSPSTILRAHDPSGQALYPGLCGASADPTRYNGEQRLGAFPMNPVGLKDAQILLRNWRVHPTGIVV